MNRLLRLGSRVCFGTGAFLLAAGMHRFIFGTRPKLIWVRDLPWDQVSAPWCFAAALALAALGAWLGRRALQAPSVAGANDIARSRVSSR
jgi:hypothetical protein